jgi:hypothetical protein
MLVGLCKKKSQNWSLYLSKTAFLCCRDVCYVQVIMIVNSAGLGSVNCSEPFRFSLTLCIFSLGIQDFLHCGLYAGLKIREYGRRDLSR